MNTDGRFVRTVPVLLRHSRAVTVDILGGSGAPASALLERMRRTAVLR
jgi:hypothetical protein